MANESILLVEDEADIAELVTYNLAREGYRITAVASGEEGLSRAIADAPDLVLLDLMLPGLDGLEVCKRLRADGRTAATPIIMVTAKGEEVDIVTGLELGADDYVTKPFSMRTLIARVRSVLRRSSTLPQQDNDGPLRIHDLEIHAGRHEVTRGGAVVALTATEFAILHFLAKRPGWVFTRYQIVDGIRGPNYPVTERSVDVQIVSLRKKLGDGADVIETVRGVGYRFKE
jgi:two-component system alkaline phosphatase synthesis response regulator PhoP